MTERLTILRAATSWETMTSFSVGHIILTPTHSGNRIQGPPHQESRALPTELPPPPPPPNALLACLKEVIQFETPKQNTDKVHF